MGSPFAAAIIAATARVAWPRPRRVAATPYPISTSPAGEGCVFEAAKPNDLAVSDHHPAGAAAVVMYSAHVIESRKVVNATGRQPEITIEARFSLDHPLEISVRNRYERRFLHVG